VLQSVNLTLGSQVLASGTGQRAVNFQSLDQSGGSNQFHLHVEQSNRQRENENNVRIQAILVGLQPRGYMKLNEVRTHLRHLVLKSLPRLIIEKNLSVHLLVHLALVPLLLLSLGTGHGRSHLLLLGLLLNFRTLRNKQKQNVSHMQ
jgi:hypothetical protein